MTTIARRPAPTALQVLGHLLGAAALWASAALVGPRGVTQVNGDDLARAFR